MCGSSGTEPPSTGTAAFVFACESVGADACEGVGLVVAAAGSSEPATVNDGDRASSDVAALAPCTSPV
jgi:hypothetical protein